MKIKIYIAMALAAGVLAACNQQSKKADHEGHEHHDHDSTKTVSQAAPVFKSEELTNVYAHYTQLKNNLVASNEAESKSASVALKAAVEGLKDAKALQAAEKTAAAADLAGIRASLNDLSKELERVIKQKGVKSGEVYLEFCPMANNDKGGYWLSNTKEILNPYYGDQMLHCGRVEETLK